MNSELHQRTVETLVKLVDILDCDELSLLMWHCGVSVTDLMPIPKKEYPLFQLFDVSRAMDRLTIRGKQDERTI